jgi:hypothetical protein
MNYTKVDDCCVSLAGEFTKGIRPTIANGVHGLIILEDEYILFEEDDGHFWDVVGLSTVQIELLKTALIELQDNLISKKANLWKFKFKNGIPKIKSPHFNLHYDIKNYIVTMIELNINGKDLEFHPCYLKGLVDCLKLKEQN